MRMEAPESMPATLGKGVDERNHAFGETVDTFVGSTTMMDDMSNLSVDDLDRRLLTLLQANARESTAQLARRLGVARTTVLARLARLERQGVITGYTVTLALDSDERAVEAYVGIVTDPKQGREVVRALSALPELRQLSSVSGEFDYVALLRAETPARLDDLLDRIGAITGVARTTTSVVLARRIDRR
jgi:DNA-binding Lrp family transcriptional regulator